MSTVTDLSQLHGRSVLVRSTRDRRNPPTALRGSIEVHQQAGAAPVLTIAVEFPQMFNSQARHRTIPLDHAALARLLATDRSGTFEFTIDEELA